MIWYTGHSLKLCCVVTIMQLENDTNFFVRSKPMHMPIYILGHVYGLKLILFSGMGGSKFRLGSIPQYTDQLKSKPMTVTVCLKSFLLHLWCSGQIVHMR